MLDLSVIKYKHLLHAQTTHTKLNVTFSMNLYSSAVSVALLTTVIKTRTMTTETVIMPTAPPLNTVQQNQWLILTHYNAL
jgi:hypothetical protein